jgi:hypothetical protein
MQLSGKYQVAPFVKFPGDYSQIDRIMRKVIAPLFLAGCVVAGEPEWPGFRGPFSNPSVTNSNLPEKWSTTSNIEWTAAIPGLGWSSPIVAGRNVFLTTVTTDGKAKQPQAGTTYSNDYTAELKKQGLQGKELRDRLNARDFEFPDEVALHYFLYSIDLDSGQDQLEARILCRPASRGASSQEQLLLGNPRHGRQACLHLHQ